MWCFFLNHDKDGMTTIEEPLCLIPLSHIFCLSIPLSSVKSKSICFDLIKSMFHCVIWKILTLNYNSKS